MINKGKHIILGIGIDAVDYENAVKQVIDHAKQKKSFTVSALAVHGVMTGFLDSEHSFRLNTFNLLVPDGQPVRWALSLLHKIYLPNRVYGPNLTLKIAEAAAKENLNIFLYGSTSSVLDLFSKNLKKLYPNINICGKAHSRFKCVSSEEQLEIAKEIRATNADIVFIGLGCPRQEIWAFEHRAILPMPLIAVGAAFDFHAGTLRQAPPILQTLSLEWLFRLVLEPKRLWKRYLILNPIFLWNVAFQFLKIKKFPVNIFEGSVEFKGYS